MDIKKIIDVATQNGMIVAPKEMVLDMLYISMANNLIPTYAVKVFEKVFEDDAIVPIPPPKDEQNVSIDETLAMCMAISSSIIEGSEKILAMELPVLDDMIMEFATLKDNGAEMYQLKNVQEEIDYRITIIAKSNAIIEIVNTYFEDKSTPE